VLTCARSVAESGDRTKWRPGRRSADRDLGMRSCADVARQRPVLPLYRIRPIVPVVVLAQTWRGGPQHQISRVLQGCDISRMTSAISPASPTPSASKSGSAQPDQHHEPHQGSRSVAASVRSPRAVSTDLAYADVEPVVRPGGAAGSAMAGAQRWSRPSYLGAACWPAQCRCEPWHAGQHLGGEPSPAAPGRQRAEFPGPLFQPALPCRGWQEHASRGEKLPGSRSVSSIRARTTVIRP
jgi:hypothetical protein